MGSYNVKGTMPDGIKTNVLMGGSLIGVYVQDLIDLGATEITIALQPPMSDAEIDAMLQQAYPTPEPPLAPDPYQDGVNQKPKAGTGAKLTKAQRELLTVMNDDPDGRVYTVRSERLAMNNLYRMGLCTINRLTHTTSATITPAGRAALAAPTEPSRAGAFALAGGMLQAPLEKPAKAVKLSKMAREILEYTAEDEEGKMHPRDSRYVALGRGNGNALNGLIKRGLLKYTGVGWDFKITDAGRAALVALTGGPLQAPLATPAKAVTLTPHQREVLEHAASHNDFTIGELSPYIRFGTVEGLYRRRGFIIPIGKGKGRSGHPAYRITPAGRAALAAPDATIVEAKAAKAVKLTKAQRAALQSMIDIEKMPTHWQKRKDGIYLPVTRSLSDSVTVSGSTVKALLNRKLIERAGAYREYRITPAGRSALTALGSEAK